MKEAVQDCLPEPPARTIGALMIGIGFLGGPLKGFNLRVTIRDYKGFV